MGWMEESLGELSRQESLLNRWNVFPVADGDTGHNMVLTLKGAVDSMRQTPSVALPVVLSRIAEGALMEARGNSGVILSQLLWGFSQANGNKAVWNATDLKHAFRRAAVRARHQVTNPVEGTILTVADAIAEEIRDDVDLGQCLAGAIEVGDRVLKETRHLVPHMRGSAMVDAGGLGYVVILRGWLTAIQGQGQAVGVPNVTAVSEIVDENRFSSEAVENYYDVQALLYQFHCEDPVEQLGDRLAQVGDSLVIAPGADAIKIHIHTSRPVELIRALTDIGDVRQMEWLDMRPQVEDHRREVSRLRIVADSRLHPLFEALHEVLDLDRGMDEPDTLWIGASRPLTSAIGVASVGLAGQLALEYIQGESWDSNRVHMLERLAAMKVWRVQRASKGFTVSALTFSEVQDLKAWLILQLEPYGITTIYLSHRARREEAVFWQETLSAELVQVPTLDPWMEIVWQP